MSGAKSHFATRVSKSQTRPRSDVAVQSDTSTVSNPTSSSQYTAWDLWASICEGETRSSMSVRYHCSHLSPPSAPLGPSYPSSSSSLHPLPDLYFCEECDAIRCDLCVGMEVASYYCPGCNFDVPSANVRGDKNR